VQDRSTDRSRTVAVRRAVYLCLVRDGMHQRGVCNRLKLGRGTVQRAVRFLLSAGAIVPSGAPSAPGAVSFYRAGPRAADWAGGPGGPGGPGVAPEGPLSRGSPVGLLVQRERGTVRIDAACCPVDPAKLPGLTKARSPNGARVFWYRFESLGEVWSAQLNVRKDGSGVLQVTAPAVTARLTPQVLDPEPLIARAQKAAIAWGQPYGLDLAREREAPRMVQPMEWAMPMPGLQLQATGRPGVDRAWVDGSHPGSIETQSPDVVRFVGDGPELRAEWERVRRIVDELLAAGQTSVQVVEHLAQATGANSRALATLVHQAVTANASPASSASPPLPVDTKDGYT